MSEGTKYRIRCTGGWYPVALYPPGVDVALGHYRNLATAVRIMDAHARGADCELFLRGYCGCREECAR